MAEEQVPQTEAQAPGAPTPETMTAEEYSVMRRAQLRGEGQVVSEPPAEPSAAATPAAPAAPESPAPEAEPSTEQAPVAEQETTPSPEDSESASADEVWPRGIRRRFDRFTERNALLAEKNVQLERELAELRARTETLTQVVSGQRAPSPDAPPVTPQRPKQDDYDTTEDYLEALADYKAEQKAAAVVEAALQKREADAAHAAEAKAQQEREAAWVSKLAAGQGKFSDFLEVTTSARPPISQESYGFMQASPYGGEIFYHLHKYPSEAAKLRELSVHDLYRELVTLEQRFKGMEDPGKPPPGKEPARPVVAVPSSPVPAPITPVGQNGIPVSTIDRGELPYEDYRRVRREDLARQ